MSVYQIKKGDTLSGIAAQYGTTVQALAQANGIANVNKIYAGQSLNIPDAAGASSGVSNSTGTSYGSAPQYSQSDNTKNAYTQWQQEESNKPGDYKESDALSGLRKQLEDWEKNKPGAYESAYQSQIDEILNGILSRGSFEYDPAKDKLYQSMADQYKQKGKQAMRDTMGNAAALTGGYGSSYAATAGSQAYDNYMQQLQDRVPELYQLALQSWQNETDSMYNKLNALNTQDDAAYGRYRDSVSDWRSDRDYLYNRAKDQYDTEYGQWRDSVGDWQSNRDYAMNKYAQLSDEDYRKYQDALSQYNEDRAFDYQKEQDDREYQLALQKAAQKSSGSSSSSKSSKTSNTGSKISYGEARYNMMSKGNKSSKYSYANKLLSKGQITESEYIRLCNEIEGAYTPGYAK